MNQPPDQRNEGPDTPNRDSDADRAPRKRGGAVLWLLLLVALLLLGWWWFNQRSAEQAETALPAATAPTGETAAPAAEAERAAAEARKQRSAEKPRKPKPAAPRVTEPRPLAGQNAQPEYPRDAQRRGLSGRVLLRVDVAADGTATNVDFVQRSGAPELDRAAMNAVRKWRFAPARSDGKPVASSVNVPVDFVLPEKN